MRPVLSWYQILTDSTREKNHTDQYYSNIKILNNILANWIQQYIKEQHIVIQCYLSQECKVGLKLKIVINIIPQQHTTKENPYDHLNGCKKLF